MSISNDGASIAGYVTNYILQFTNAVALAQGSWFRLQFPSGYGFGTTLCAFLSPSFDITCSNKSNYLYLTGLSQALPAGTYRIRLRNIQNPYSKGSQTGFLFESLKEGTNTVIEQSSSMNAITITAGAINSPSITASPLNKNLRVDYTISFTPSNTIPQGGSIQITFPSTYGSLDSTCRVIRGLTATSAGLVCTANSTSGVVTISGFTETPPQYIQIKIYAVNPNVVGPTPQFAIASYRTYPATSTSLIDENTNAGQVSIVDVDNPFLIEIDVYTPYTNTSLGATAPLDFRLYVQNILPATTSSTSFGKVWLQIPLWWSGISTNQVYRCNFGALDSGDSGGCSYYNQIWKMSTPVNSILSQCDVPISLDYVRVTPIPGRWDFRVLTFINTTSAPVEQDLWTMDIPADPLASATGYSTTLDVNNNNAILRVTFNTIVVVPVEGCINFNMSTVQDVYANTAAWDGTLGFNYGSENFTSVSCRIVINGNVVGYTGSNHPKANCVAYKAVGNSTNAIIQIRGWSSQLGTGTSVSVDVPNVKVCGDVGMNCVFELTTAYTTTLDNPYTLNYLTVNLGLIQSPYNPVTGTVGVKPTFTPTMICQTADYTFTITPLTTLTSTTRDHILIIFPAAKYTFKRDLIGSNVGNVAVIYVSETDEIYFLIRLTTTVASGAARTITLTSVINSNGETKALPRVDDFSGVVTKAIYWGNYKEIEHITFIQTDPYTDGGIWATSMTYYPNVANNAAATFTRNLNLDDLIPFSITFSVCHIIPSDGGIKIDVPVSSYQYVNNTCQARSGLTGQTNNNGFTTLLNCSFNGSAFLVTGFQQVAQFTSITIGFSVKSKTTSTTPGNYYITTFYDTAFTWLNDWVSPVIPSPVAIPGPKKFPLYLDFVDWLAAPKIARVGTLGAFRVQVNMSVGLPAYTSSNDAHILFKMDTNMSITAGSGLECRHNGSISYHCQVVGTPTGTFNIKMPTNQFTGIAQGVSQEVLVTTLGAYNSSNYDDGIYFNRAGRYTLTAEAYNGGSLTESSQLEFEVYGKDFLKYWVYSFNKGRGGLTLVRIFATLDVGDSFPSSEDPSLYGLIVLEFSHNTTNGFAGDLGTGIADKGSIPCNSAGLPILSQYTDISCTLIIGLYNNPTRIEISGFNVTDQVNNPNFEIIIPKIYNPYSAALTFDVPDVVTRIYEVNVATGDKNELFYHSYDLINVTYPQSPATTSVTISTAPTLSLTKLSANLSTLSVFIRPTYALSPSDHIVIELPLFWKPTRSITCNVGGNTVCEGHPDANWIVADLTTSTIGTGGVTATFVITNPPAMLPPTAMIKAYYYHAFKLWNIASYPALGTTLVPFDITDINITSSDGTANVQASFVFSFITPQPIPAGGAIWIQIPSAYTISDTSCENDAIGGSQVGDKGFQCSIDSSGNLIAYGFPAVANNSLVVIDARLTNPSSSTTATFTVQTHYIYQAAPLQTLIATVSKAATVTAATAVSYWDAQYRATTYLYATDIGPVKFLINFPTTLATTDYVKVNVPTGFSLAPDGQAYCDWDGVPAFSCVWASNVITLTSPNVTALTASTNITLKLSTLNADSGINGLVFPSTAGTYQFTVTSYTSANVLKEQQVINVIVYAPKFTVFYSTTEIINYNMKTSIKVQFQPATQVPVGGKLILYVPTRNSENGLTLFDNDLRSGIADGGSIACHDVGSSFGFEPTCTLKYGNQQLGTPAQITVSGWTSPLVVTANYTFRVNQVWTPAYPADDKHVIMRLESWSSTAVINAGLHYDFTIQKFDPTVYNSPTTPSTAPMNADQSGATFTLDLYSTQLYRHLAVFDYFIVEFPTLIQQPLGLKCVAVTNTDCVSLPGNNWVFYQKSDADLTAANSLSTLILNAKQVSGVINSTSSVFTSYAVRNRVVVTKVVYPAIDYSSLTVQTITATVTAPSITAGYIPNNAPVQFLMTFTIPSGSINIVVPSTGAIQITLPTTVTAVDNFCMNDATSSMTGDYSCTLVTTSGIQSYSITGFDQLNYGTTVAISFWGQYTPTTAATPVFGVALYKDAAMTIKISSNAAVNGPAISTYKGFQKIYPMDTNAVNPFTARAGDVAPFNFYVTLSATTVTSLTVVFPTSVTVPTGASLICGWNSYEAKSCTYTSSPLTVTIETPHTPALATGTAYKVFITTTGATGTNLKGLSFSTAGKIAATVTTSLSEVLQVPIDIYAPDFTSLILSPLWSNAAVNNYLAVALQPQTAIPQNGKIVISFPQVGLDGSTLFAADLGTGLASGSSYTCSSETLTTFVPLADQIVCTLYYVTGAYTKVEITGFDQVLTSSAIEFFLGYFKNPAGGDTAHVHLTVHTEDTSGNILNKRTVLDVFTGQTITPTTTSSSYTRDSDVLLASLVTYTFSSLAQTKPITTRGTIVIQFPVMFTLSRSISVSITSGGTAASISFKTYANYIVVTPTSDFPNPTGAILITLSGLTNPISQDTSALPIHVFFVYYRSYEVDYSAALSTVFTAGTLSVASFSSSSQGTGVQLAGTETDFYFEISTSSKIPKGGAIQVSLPLYTNVSYFGSGMVSAGLKAPLTVSSTSTSTSSPASTITFVLGRAYDPSVNGNIKFRVTALTPTTVGVSTITIKAFYDSSVNRLIASGTKAFTSTAAARTAASSVVISSGSYAKVSSTAPIVITYTLSAAPATTVNEVHVSIGTFTYLSTPACTINGGATLYCGYDSSTGLLVIGVDTTTNPLTATTTIGFSLTAPSAAGIGRLYISYATVTRASSSGTSIGAASATTYANSGTVGLTIYSNAFNSLTITPIHLTIAQPTFVRVQATLGSTDAPSPVFYVDLPRFPSTLGLDSTLGTTVPCQSSVSTTVLTCTLESSINSWKFTRVKVVGYADLTAGSSVDFRIFRITNPSAAGDYEIGVKLVSLTIGNTETGLYGGSDSWTFAAATSPATASSSSTLTLGSGYVVRTSQSYGLGFSLDAAVSAALTGSSTVFYHLPYFNYMVTPSSSASCTSATCTLYDKAGVVVMPVSTGALAAANTISGLNNPPGVPASTSTVIAYLVNNNQLVQINTYTPASAWTAAAITGAALTPLSAGQGTGYTPFYLTFTLINSIPAGGVIRLTLPTSAFTTASSVVATGLKVVAGTYTGTLQLSTTTSPSVYIDIKGFTSFSAGTVSLYLSLNQVKTGTYSTGSSVTSYLDSSATIAIDTASITWTVDANPHFRLYNNYEFVLGATPTVKGGTGIFAFGFKQSASTGALSSSSSRLRVIPPSTFPFDNTLPIRCKFTDRTSGTSYLSQECYKDGSAHYVIYPPTSSVTLAVSEWQVTIFTVGSDSRGLPFPSTNVKHIFTVNIETPATTPVTVETNIMRFRLFNSLTTTGFVDTYLNNINEKNLVRFRAKLTTAVSTSGLIYIEFPMVDPTGTINSDSLYTGLVFRNLFACIPKVGGTLITANCRLIPGNVYEQKPTIIAIDTLSSAISAGTIFDVAIPIINGATTSVWTSARLTTYDSSSATNLLDFYTFDYVTYTSNPTAATDTQSFPTFTVNTVQSLTNFPLALSPASSVTLAASNSRIRFAYNSFLYGGTTQGVSSHTMEQWSNSLAFITFLSDPGATPKSFTMTNFMNPVSVAPYTSALVANIIQKKVIVSTTSYTSTPPTPTAGTFTSATMTQDSLLRSQVAQYQVSFVLDKAIPVNGGVYFTFPTGYTLVGNTCAISGVTSTTCSINGLSVYYGNFSAVAASTTLTIYVNAKNPATAGSTGTFTLTSEDAANYTISTRTVPAVTISSTLAFNYLISLPLKTDAKLAQAADYAPLTFTVLLVNSLPMGNTAYIDFLFPTASPEYALPPTTLLGTDLVCMWGTLAASDCERVTDGYRVYTPMMTGLTAGTNYTVKITTNRNWNKGFKYPVVGSYAVTATDSSSAVISKQFTVLNEAFESAYIVSRITTNNRHTMLYLRFTPRYDINPESALTRGQVIVELPTLLSNGRTVFPVDLGKGINNGDSVDCVSNQAFNCKISKGGVSVSAPTSIIMDPQLIIYNYTDVEVKLAWIQTAYNDNTYTPLRVYFRSYDPTTSKWTVIEELLKDNIFYTTLSTIDTTQSNLAAPTFSPNTVGAPTTVTWNFNLQNTLTPNTYDRLIIFSNTTNISVQTTGVNCGSATVTTHTIGQWYEVAPTTSLASSSSFSLTFTNWTNVPYVISGGIKWYIYVWQGTNLKQIIIYQNTATVSPHAFQPTPSIVAYNTKIRAVSTYEISFFPYNPIPAGGAIQVGIPKEYMAVNPECTIQGLTGATCVIQDDGDYTTDDYKFVTLTGFTDYFPATDGAIKLELTLINPKIGGSIGPFTLTTNYTGGYVIDQTLNLGYITIDASATFYEFSLNSLQQLQTKTCGGRPGPMKIKFSINNALYFPNDYITITLDNAFSQPPIYAEVLCYFIYNDIYNLKTHRCDWTGNTIVVYAPEEKNFTSGDVITLVVTTRGADVKYYDGVSVPSVPGQYFVRVTTSNNLEEGYPIAYIPACPFNRFFGDSAIWNAGSNTLLNFYVNSTAALPDSASGGRIVVEVPTHNEIHSTFDTDLGTGIPVGNTSKAIGCGSGCANCPYGTPLTQYSGSNIECTLMEADGQNYGDRAVIFTTNLQAVPINTYYNFQIGKIMNPSTSGWPYWSHIRIRTQMKAADGSYTDLNDHWAYFIVPTYAAANTIAAVSGATPGLTDSRVNYPTNVSFAHTNPGGVMTIGDYLIYEFYPNDFLLPNWIRCDQNYNVTDFAVIRCAAMKDSNWVGAQIQNNYTTYRNVIYQNMRQPYYVVQGGIQVLGYEVHNHLIYKVITFSPFQNTANNIEVVMQTPSNTNDVGLTLKYQIGVFLWTPLSYVKYVRLTMPSDFVNPNSCVPRRGLILQDVNNPYLPIQCVITLLGGTSGYRIELFNFTLGDSWFIVDMTITNPATPRFTGTWIAYTYDNYNGTYTNLTRIMDQNGNSDGRTWIGVKPFPTLFRVYRNTESFYDRLAKEGEWGEIDMRLITKKDIPAGSGSIQIWLPDEYNIANGGDAVCTIGNTYHDDLDSSSCTITSDRKIYMSTNSDTGIPAGTCSLITATTINSANGDNGFQMPSTAGSYSFQVFMYNGTNLQEYSDPGSSVLPEPLSSLSIRVVHKETSLYSVVRVNFAVPITVPAGYDTATNVLDAYSKPAIGSVTINFNTLDDIGGSTGWPLDLGRGGATDIPCKVFSGLTVRSGYSNIACTLTISASANPKNPATITLSNFEQITTGTTNIEVHFLNLQNPPLFYRWGGLDLNNGQISVGAYETFGDGSTTDIIESTSAYQPPIIYVYVTPQTWTYAMLGSTFISPNTVGSTLIVNFPYTTTISLAAGDVFKFIFPTPQFDLPVDGSLSAVVDGVQLIPYVYEDKRINEIHFEIPTGYGMTSNSTFAETKIIKVSQLLNMAYAASANYQIELWVIKSGRRVEHVYYSGLPPATASAPNSLSLVLSSLFSGDVYVTYNFTIVPSYTVPAGSTFTINLPSPQYDYLYSSSPSMICSLLSSAYLTNCGGTATPGTGTTITFTALTDIAKGTSLSLQLTGVKNPSYVGTLAAGAINMVITHPNGMLINQGDFSKITFVSPKSPGKISLDVAASSYYKSVDADYTFSLQNSNSLPVGGKIIMNFAADWAAAVLSASSTITSLTGSFTSNTLYYTASYNSATGVLTLTTQFTWPAKTSIYIKVNDKNNPSTINTTQVFRASTSYDGVTLDQTDPLDESTTITFETPPPAINVVSSSIYPTNEGELATYNFTLSPASDILAGSLLYLIFPDTYGPLLTSVDADIECSSASMPTLTCSVVDGKLVVSLPDGVSAGSVLDLVITGITNPNAGTTGAISLMTTTSSGNETLQYASKVIPVTSTDAPKAMDLTKLTTSSTNLQAQATYQLCGATDGAIPVNAQVFINFPQQFTLRQSSYVCSTTSDNNALNYPSGPTCVIQNNIRRFVFTGQDNSLPGGTLKSLCYQIDGVENPADSGETNSFSMEVFDPATSSILYRSYGTLSYPTTLTYKRVGLRIIVSSIPDFVVGLMSDYVNIQLERSVPYEVILQPKSTGFTFDPANVVFTPGLSTTQQFRIIPDAATVAGSYYITWNKTEDSTSTRFAEVADSYFNYVATAAFNKYKVIIGTTVSRTALRGTSLPISVTLTQSPAKNLTVSYVTSKPSQPDYMTFNPPSLVFKPGELTKTFQYTTTDGAVSGLILFSLDSTYSSIYYMETDTINVEILDIDTEPPEVLNEYIVTMDRTYMYYRISTSESAWVYYLLTLKGTIAPPIDEIKDPSLRVTRGTKTDVMELTGKNSSYQADLTTTYIYYDNYLMFTGLEEQTDYVLYYVVEDLSGNDLSTRKIEFTTFKKHQPVMFNVLLSNDTDLDSLEAAFSLVTGMETSRWNIVAAPPKFDIPNNDDPLVQAILDAGTVTYNIMLLQNITADEKRPIEIVSLLETNKYLLLDEIPTIVSDYNINEYSYEVLQFANEITYQPLLVEVDEDYGTLNVSLKRNGTLFGVVLPKGSTKPSARQIKYGLDSTNFLVADESYVKVTFEYAETLPYGVVLNKLVSFTNLFDNTEYEAHFIGQNTLPVNPDLMSDDEIMTVSFVTQRELFVIPDDYQSSPIMEVSKLLIILLAGLLLLL